jgi:hypothetical protein
MYNNKQYRTAQKTVGEGVENIKEYLGNVFQNTSSLFGGVNEKVKSFRPEIKEIANKHNLDEKKVLAYASTSQWAKLWPFVQEVIKLGYDAILELGPQFGGDMLVLKLFQWATQQAAKEGIKLTLFPAAAANPSLLGGLAGMAGAQVLMNVAENAKGDLAIYKDYMSDYIKDLDAILKLLPKNEDVKVLCKIMKDVAYQGLDKIEKAKMQKTSKRRNYRIAIRGEANWGSYGHQFLEGAGFGAGSTGGSWQGALAGGLGFGLADAARDIAHHMNDDDYKATAYAAELNEKVRSMVNQVKKYDKGFADTLSQYGQQFEDYFRKYIFSPNALENFRDKFLFPKKEPIETPYNLLSEMKFEKEQQQKRY